MEYVPGRGPRAAEICVVGEAPGRKEVEAGAPFVGPSGKLQEQWIEAAGLRPGVLRYENVYPFFPPGGAIEGVKWEELQRWMEDCRARLDDLVSVRVIVPTGNVALGTLLMLAPSQARITQRRGSIYLWSQASGRKVKVIPVIHPAAVLREEGERAEENGQQVKKNYEARCRADWRKVAREVGTGIENVPPQRMLWAGMPVELWNETARRLGEAGNPLAFDIETNPEQGKILCVSFANCAEVAVSVPWSRQYKPGIQALLASPCPKITQNGQYDCYWLAQEGMQVINWQWDTMAMHCLLEPGEPHSLAYLASIYTREPWYKGGDEDTGEKAWAGQKWEELLEYNARDAAVTWECWAALKQELETRDGTESIRGVTHGGYSSVDTGRADNTTQINDTAIRASKAVWSDGALSHKNKQGGQVIGSWMRVYQEQYQALFQPILRAMLHGMCVDKEELDGAFSLSMAHARLALAGAQEAAGGPLFTFNTQVQEACWKVHSREWDRDDPEVAKKLKRAKGEEASYIAQVEAKGISTQILGRVLYQEMKLPAQRKRRTGNVTTDEAALLKLRARFKDGGKFPQAMQLIEQALIYREKKKQSEFLDPGRLDKDDRFRASYSFRPATGRLSSSNNPRDSGGNAQNIDRALRRPFKPDLGCLLLEVDLSQAESRDVYCLTRDKHLIEMAHTRPSEFDVHSFMAGEVMGFGPWDVSTEAGKKQKKDDRYLAKRVVHATHYDMHANKGSEICLKDGYDISPRAFARLQQKYKDFAPGLSGWQQRTRMEGLRERQLTNAWGRTIRFPYDKPGDDWYRRLYAWRPQSDIARHLNRAWACLDEWLECTGRQSKVNLQLHDALIISVPPEESWEVMSFLVQVLEEPHCYYGEELTIPAEIKLGLAWGEGKEFKEKPSREEWEGCLETLIDQGKAYSPSR